MKKVIQDIQNILNRYKLQALLSIKNAEEKNQRVFDKIAKLRIGSVLQNSRRSYKYSNISSNNSSKYKGFEYSGTNCIFKNIFLKSKKSK